MADGILQLAWSDKYGTKHIIGELEKKDSKYFCRYNLDGVKQAQKFGFRPLVSFPQLNATYENSFLFPMFSSRVPDKRRPDMDKILATYNLSAFEPFEYLKASGGRLPIDKFEFIDIDSGAATVVAKKC